MTRVWSSTATWNWTTTGVSGDFYAAVWAREASSGSAAPQAQRTAGFTIRSAGGCASVTLTPNVASARTADTVVTFTGAVAGCASPQHQFWLYTAGTWAIMRAWSASPTWAWDTTAVTPGTVYVAVDARNSASGGRETVAALV